MTGRLELGTAVDVAERRRAEEALRRTAGYLAEAQRLSHCGSWAWDVATRENVHWSAEHYRLFGLDPEGGTSSFEEARRRIHPDDRPVFDATLERAIREKTDFEVDFRVVLPDGSTKHLHSVGHPVVGADGEVVEYLGTALDVTEQHTARVALERAYAALQAEMIERRNAEEALGRAQADLAHVSRVLTMGELTASIAHEMKQPLAAVVTNAHACLRWLARETPELGEAREAAARIARDGTRASEIVDGIRALFNKGPPRKVPVHVNPIVGETTALLRDQALRHGVSLRTELSPSLRPVMADRVLLQQVVLNLTMNAIDATSGVTDRPRDVCVCSSETPQHEVLVGVRDSGVGLKPEELEKVFAPFFTTKPHGIGMGLSVCSSIVESHGGRLWVTRNPDHGVTFQFALPVPATGTDGA